ncbi:MAG: tRNA 2-selenouridine(34) synthase MnmH [Sarcina sp.]
MFGMVEFSEIYGNEKDYIFVDVRSESEFFEDAIEGAVNIPILLDKEREIVGTTYVRESVDKAKMQGIEFASKRLPFIFKEFQKLIKGNPHKKIVIYCARGGMRSGSIHGLLNSVGIHILKLKGGYKAYRGFITKKLEEYCNEVKFIVLYGNTGIGKTEILYKLKEKNYNILDIEKAANHRGSILGGVGLGDCHSQKKFETLIYNQLRDRNSNIVFAEGESRRLYKILITQCLWDSLHKGEKVYLTADLEVRAERLVKEYTAFETAGVEINQAIKVLGKHISEEKAKHYMDLVNSGEYKTVAMELMEKYYDPMYVFGTKKNEFCERFHIESVDSAVNKLIDLYDNLK